MSIAFLPSRGRHLCGWALLQETCPWITLPTKAVQPWIQESFKWAFRSQTLALRVLRFLTRATQFEWLMGKECIGFLLIGEMWKLPATPGLVAKLLGGLVVHVKCLLWLTCCSSPPPISAPLPLLLSLSLPLHMPLCWSTASPGPAALSAACSVLSKLLSPSPSASLSAPAVQHGINSTLPFVLSLCGLHLWGCLGQSGGLASMLCFWKRCWKLFLEGPAQAEPNSKWWPHGNQKTSKYMSGECWTPPSVRK